MKQVQVEFCDGTLENFVDNTNRISLPLLQLLISKVDLSIREDKVDDTFNPASRFFDYFACPDIGEEKPPLFELMAGMHLESTYFNQITQVFEPFVEPWFIDVLVSKVKPKDLYDIRVKSNKLLNVNVTFGMALSLRNILFEIQDILAEIDKAISRRTQTLESEVQYQPSSSLKSSSIYSTKVQKEKKNNKFKFIN